MRNTTVEPLSYRPKDAARALGISERKLWTLTQRGEVPHVRVGGCLLYPVDALRDYLTLRTVGGVQAVAAVEGGAE